MQPISTIESERTIAYTWSSRDSDTGSGATDDKARKLNQENIRIRAVLSAPLPGTSALVISGRNVNVCEWKAKLLVLQERACKYSEKRHEVKQWLLPDQSNDSLLKESQHEAERLYGSRASSYCPEPSSISRMKNFLKIKIYVNKLQGDINLFCKEIGKRKTALYIQIKASESNEEKSKYAEEMNRLASLHDRAKEIVEPAQSRTQMNLYSQKVKNFQQWCPVRPAPQVEVPEGLTATMDGYSMILDYYRYRDSSLYQFGSKTPRAQCYNAINRRNVAIMTATHSLSDPSLLFSNFAVSGKHTAGVKAQENTSLLKATACRSKISSDYERNYDAEFKLATCLVSAIPDRAEYTGTISLWSRKELCVSCNHVINEQLRSMLPKATINIVIG
ncbi:deaminase domain-containing protein [Endozoicomonas lisbonensis]